MTEHKIALSSLANALRWKSQHIISVNVLSIHVLEVKPGQQLHLLHSKGLFIITVPHFQKIASQNGSWAVLKLESSEKMTREHCRVFQWRKFFLIHVQVTLQVKDKRGNGSEQASAIDYTIAGHSVSWYHWPLIDNDHFAWMVDGPEFVVEVSQNGSCCITRLYIKGLVKDHNCSNFPTVSC